MYLFFISFSMDSHTPCTSPQCAEFLYSVVGSVNMNALYKFNSHSLERSLIRCFQLNQDIRCTYKQIYPRYTCCLVTLTTRNSTAAAICNIVITPVHPATAGNLFMLLTGQRMATNTNLCVSFPVFQPTHKQAPSHVESSAWRTPRSLSALSTQRGNCEIFLTERNE